MILRLMGVPGSRKRPWIPKTLAPPVWVACEISPPPPPPTAGCVMCFNCKNAMVVIPLRALPRQVGQLGSQVVHKALEGCLCGLHVALGLP
jgi:hypothetical protein